MAERFPHARIAEFAAPQIENKPRHAGRPLMGDFPLDDLAGFYRREIIGRGPILRGVLAAEIIFIGLEGFQRDSLVSVEIESDDVKIINTLLQRQIARPVIGHALVLDKPARLELADPVGPAAERPFQRGLGEVAGLPVVLRQHGKLAGDLGQLAVRRTGKVELDLQSPKFFRLGNIGVVEPIEGRALFPQQIEAEDNIVGDDRLAVMEPGVPAQGEGGVG